MSDSEPAINVGGRPEFEPTAEQRDQVEIAAFMGMTELAIASAIGISVPTLRKYFRDELDNGHSRKRLEVALRLFKQMRDDNTSATKQLEHLGAMVAGPRAPGPAPKPEELGKKAEANLAAKEPPPKGSKWAALN